MPDPSTLRDSTEIILPCDSIDGLDTDLEREFAVSVFSEEAGCRIVGSPVEIKAASDFLARHGVTLP